jgi:hypothetical protein
MDKTARGAKKSAARARRSARAAGEVANAAVVESPDLAGFFVDGKETVDTEELRNSTIVGVGLPSLAPRYLFQMDVLPLGRCCTLAGVPGSGKTATQFEVLRWITVQGGGGLYVENENKDATSMRLAMLEYNDSLDKKIRKRISNCQEEWMRHIGDFIQEKEDVFQRTRVPGKIKRQPGETITEYRERQKPRVVAGKPGWVAPIGIALDSLTGTGARAAIAKILDEGAPDRTYPLEANLLSQWSHALPTLLRSRPIFLMVNAHNKPTKENGIEVDKIPGGYATHFVDSLRIRTKPIKAAPLHPDQGGILLDWKVIKNSGGPKGLSLQVMLKWWYEEDEATGQMRQRMAFDWDRAAIELLLEQRRTPARWKKIMEVCDLAQGTQGRVSSKALGIPASSPVKAAEAGRILESRPDLLDGLYDVLHIARKARMVPGVPYEDTQVQLARQAEAARLVLAPRDLSGGDFLDDLMEDVANGDSDD